MTLGLYRHRKGDLYRLLHVATESTNDRAGRKVAVYVSMSTGELHTRDWSEWTEMVNGTRRFVLIKAMP